MQKREAGGTAKKVCPGAETIVATGMGAVPLLKNGRADHYFGACESGGSAAISTLIGLMGHGKCYIVCKNGEKSNEEEVCEYVKDGKICFGMMVPNADGTVLVLMKMLLEQGDR